MDIGLNLMETTQSNLIRIAAYCELWSLFVCPCFCPVYCNIV